jgi:GTP-binding protein
MFVDRVTIDVTAGKGGDGCVSFRRERYIPRGGPDGGDGGRGGSVIIVAETGVDSLTAISHRKHWVADRGVHGQGSNRTGKNAKDVILKVPPGTIVMDETEGIVLRDLAAEGDQVTAARGGKGGKGNVHFKSSTNQAPRERTVGEPGERRRLLLELKVIADVGLIGKPNAGKSTLLSRLTKARPEIAAYPFTTKHPNLGRVQIDFERSFVMADIPGLIEGAHAGVGLGHEFLRHIQRTGVLVHLVEPMPMDATDPIQNYYSIREELTKFDPLLGERPEVVAVTKCELPDAEQVHARLSEELDVEPLLISAVTGQGLNQLTAAVFDQLLQKDPS